MMSPRSTAVLASRIGSSRVSASISTRALSSAFLPTSTTTSFPRKSLPLTSSRTFSSTFFTLKDLSKTGLYDFHLENGAKMVPFAGYEMPLNYKDVGQVASHLHVREQAGLFDVGHMVQHHFSGPGSLAFLSHLLPSSLSTLEPFTSTLSVLLNHEGGILDDTVVTRQDGDKFYVVTNAGRRTEDLAWIKARLDEWKGESVQHDILENWGLVALQGPKAAEVLSKHADIDLSELTFGKSANAKVAGVDCHIARGGYTGEDGFEISIPPTSTVDVTRALTETSPVQLAGLAARDSLRLEAGMCLYGHDLDESVSPVEAGLAWTIGKDRRASADFIGHSRVLSELASKNPPRRRVGLIVEGAPAREGAAIFSSEEESVQIGRITSGIPSPSLGKNIAMGLVLNGNHKAGTTVLVEVRRKLREAEIVKMPFVENRFYRG